MARYKEFEKPGCDWISIRMHVWIDSNGKFSTTYSVLIEDNEPIPFKTAESAEKYCKKLGYKEHIFKY